MPPLPISFGPTLEPTHRARSATPGESPNFLRLAVRLALQDQHAFLDLAASQVSKEFHGAQVFVYPPDEAGNLALHGRQPRAGVGAAAMLKVDRASRESLVVAWLESHLDPLVQGGEGPWEACVAIESPPEVDQAPLGVLRVVGGIGGTVAVDVALLKRCAQDLGWAMAYLSQVARQKPELAVVRATNRDLEAVIYTAAHDLTEPIRTLTEFSGFLQEERRRDLDADTLEDVRRIHRGGLRLKRMVDDLLRFSKAGHVGAPLKVVDPSEVAADVLEALAGRRSEPIGLGCRRYWPIFSPTRSSSTRNRRRGWKFQRAVKATRSSFLSATTASGFRSSITSRSSTFSSGWTPCPCRPVVARA